MKTTKYLNFKLDPEKTFLQNLLTYQLINIALLIVMFLVYLIFQGAFKEFDFFGNWLKSENIWNSILNYWYVFAWAAGLSIIFATRRVSFSRAKTLFGLETLTSILAGIWEEIGYRGLFILTGMITIIITNFFFKWVIIIAIIAFILWLAFEVFSNFFFRIIALVLGGIFIFWFANLNIIDNPIYWFYEYVIFPVMNFISFGLLDSILYNPEYTLLFIAGALTANSQFRDGHKYQGWLGYFNSWVMGFILLHVMMYHGLLVAIIIHIIYDVLIAIIEFLKRIITN